MKKNADQTSMFDLFTSAPQPEVEVIEPVTPQTLPSGPVASDQDLPPWEAAVVEETPVAEIVTDLSRAALTYELFVSDTCPNCPPFKAFVAENLIPGMGRIYNLSTEDDALPMAKKREVYELPTFLIVDNAADRIVARSRTVPDMVQALKSYVGYIPSVKDIQTVLTSL